VTEVTRNVAEIAPPDRRVPEHVLGAPLADGQQVTERAFSPAECEAYANGEPGSFGDKLPEWCNVYEGLSDEDVAAIEAVVLSRGDLTPGAD
jgi:hypothetical protein